mmetsp:Transcript_13664/g.22770  ORF Transcript_13664/g.22770 Transcript_13664/m.22770 type:complete len:278 (-) Transcript_13664:847-1680(-)
MFKKITFPIIALAIVHVVMSFRSNPTKIIHGLTAMRRLSMSSAADISVMINGMPGLMALETAKACLDRGMNVLDVGFTGPRNQLEEIVVEGAKNSQIVKLVKGPGISPDAPELLKAIRSSNENLVIVDYTHPSSALGNIQCYIDCNCDFVMGTTGLDQSEIDAAFTKGGNHAVIAPNMAKQIVAVQFGLLEMAERFPGSFNNYELEVSESHQSTKADTSGTAKAIVKNLAILNGANFNTEDIVKLRTKPEQLAFNVPEDALGGHAFHTYTLTSADKR